MLASASPALAAEPTASELALARDEFKRGVTASKEERWEQAFEAFSRAFALSARTEILFNLGGAAAKTGRFVEARASYQRFLREAPKAEVEKRRRDAESMLQDLEPRIPKALITVDGLELGDQLTIDGHTVGRAILGAELPLNPGAHVLVVVRDEGAARVRADFLLSERETKPIVLDATRAPAPPPVVSAPPALVERPVVVTTPPPPEDSGLLASPIFWIVTGALAIGAAITVGVVLSRDEDAYRGSSGIVLEGLAVKM